MFCHCAKDCELVHGEIRWDVSWSRGDPFPFSQANPPFDNDRNNQDPEPIQVAQMITFRPIVFTTIFLCRRNSFLNSFSILLPYPVYPLSNKMAIMLPY